MENLFLGIILVIGGIAQAIEPTLMWDLSSRWKAEDDPRPKRGYLLALRIGGILLTVLGVIMLAISAWS